MSFPIFWIHGDEGEHIDGRLEHIEFSVSAEVMKTISGIAALHILPEGLSKTVGTAFVSVARNTLIVRPHKDTVVIFAVLKESLCFRKISCPFGPFPAAAYRSSIDSPDNLLELECSADSSGSGLFLPHIQNFCCPL